MVFGACRLRTHWWQLLPERSLDSVPDSDVVLVLFKAGPYLSGLTLVKGCKG